jgi:hypothetical protein
MSPPKHTVPHLKKAASKDRHGLFLFKKWRGERKNFFSFFHFFFAAAKKNSGSRPGRLTKKESPRSLKNTCGIWIFYISLCARKFRIQNLPAFLSPESGSEIAWSGFRNAEKDVGKKISFSTLVSTLFVLIF